MDSRSVAAAAVKKNLGPDPSMGRKVELLRRLVSMRQERKGPKATTNPPRRGRHGERRPVRDGLRLEVEEGGGLRMKSRPTRLPRRDRMPARFNDLPGYNFGPPRGM